MLTWSYKYSCKLFIRKKCTKQEIRTGNAVYCMFAYFGRLKKKAASKHKLDLQSDKMTAIISESAPCGNRHFVFFYKHKTNKLSRNAKVSFCCYCLQICLDMKLFSHFDRTQQRIFYKNINWFEHVFTLVLQCIHQYFIDTIGLYYNHDILLNTVLT